MTKKKSSDIVKITPLFDVGALEKSLVENAKIIDEMFVGAKVYSDIPDTEGSEPNPTEQSFSQTEYAPMNLHDPIQHAALSIKHTIGDHRKFNKNLNPSQLYPGTVIAPLLSLRPKHNFKPDELSEVRKIAACGYIDKEGFDRLNEQVVHVIRHEDSVQLAPIRRQVQELPDEKRVVVIPHTSRSFGVGVKAGIQRKPIVGEKAKVFFESVAKPGELLIHNYDKSKGVIVHILNKEPRKRTIISSNGNGRVEVVLGTRDGRSYLRNVGNKINPDGSLGPTVINNLDIGFESLSEFDAPQVSHEHPDQQKVQLDPLTMAPINITAESLQSGVKLLRLDRGTGEEITVDSVLKEVQEQFEEDALARLKSGELNQEPNDLWQSIAKAAFERTHENFFGKPPKADTSVLRSVLTDRGIKRLAEHIQAAEHVAEVDAETPPADKKPVVKIMDAMSAYRFLGKNAPVDKKYSLNQHRLDGLDKDPSKWENPEQYLNDAFHQLSERPVHVHRALQYLQGIRGGPVDFGNLIKELYTVEPEAVDYLRKLTPEAGKEIHMSLDEFVNKNIALRKEAKKNMTESDVSKRIAEIAAAMFPVHKLVGEYLDGDIAGRFDRRYDDPGYLICNDYRDNDIFIMGNRPDEGSRLIVQHQKHRQSDPRFIFGRPIFYSMNPFAEKEDGLITMTIYVAPDMESYRNFMYNLHLGIQRYAEFSFAAAYAITTKKRPHFSEHQICSVARYHMQLTNSAREMMYRNNESVLGSALTVLKHVTDTSRGKTIIGEEKDDKQ